MLGRQAFLILVRMSSYLKGAIRKLPGMEWEIDEMASGVQFKAQEGTDGQFLS